MEHTRFPLAIYTHFFADDHPTFVALTPTQPAHITGLRPRRQIRGWVRGLLRYGAVRQFRPQLRQDRGSVFRQEFRAAVAASIRRCARASAPPFRPQTRAIATPSSIAIVGCCAIMSMPALTQPLTASAPR